MKTVEHFRKLADKFIEDRRIARENAKPIKGRSYYWKVSK